MPRCLLDATSRREHLANRFVGMDAANGFGEERSNGKDVDVVQPFLGGEWNCIGDNQALDGGFAKQFNRRATKDTVGSG